MPDGMMIPFTLASLLIYTAIPIVHLGAAGQEPLQAVFDLERRLDLEGALLAYEQIGQVRRDALGAEALLRAAQLGEALHGGPRAARNLAAAARMIPSDPRAPGCLLRAARLWEEAGEALDARRLAAPVREGAWQMRVKKRQRVEARLLLGRLDHVSGQLRRANERFEAVVKAYGAAEGKEKKELASLAAEAAFRLAETQFKQLDWSHELGSSEQVKDLLNQRLEAIKLLDRKLLAVMEIGSLAWSCSALLATGRLYERFAQWLWEFPPPASLSGEQIDIYRQALEDSTSSIWQKAEQAYRAVIGKVAENHLAADLGREARFRLLRLEEHIYRAVHPWWLMRRRPADFALSRAQADKQLRQAIDHLHAAPGRADLLLDAAEGLIDSDRARVGLYVLEHLVPAGLEADLLRVRALIELDEGERAYPLAWALVEAYPHNRAGWQLLLDLQLTFGDLSGAARLLNGMLQRKPKDRAARLARGIVRFGQEKFQAARTDLETIVRLQPDWPEAQQNLGVLLLHIHAAGLESPDDRQERLGLAVVHLERARVLRGEGDADLDELLTQARRALEQFNEARPAPKVLPKEI